MVQDFRIPNFLFYLKDKYRNDYNNAMTQLEEEYGFSKVDYKLFHPNLLRNDEYIELHHKNHRYFTIDKPIVAKKKHINKITK